MPQKTNPLAPVNLEGLGIRDAYEIGVAHTIQNAGNNLAPFVLVPSGMKLQPITEHNAPAPLRDFVAGKAKLEDVASFCAYVNRYKTAKTLVAVTATGLIASLDYHAAAGQPARNQHSADYVLTESEEFKAWKKIDGVTQSQDDFATFLEDRAIDVIRPTSGEIMEVVLSIEASTSAEFRSAQRLENGNVSLAYVEQTEARAGQKGELEIPKELIISIPLYRHEAKVVLNAKLRTVVRGGTVTFTVKLQQVEQAVDAAVEALREAVLKATEINPLRGTL